MQEILKVLNTVQIMKDLNLRLQAVLSLPGLDCLLFLVENHAEKDQQDYIGLKDYMDTTHRML